MQNAISDTKSTTTVTTVATILILLIPITSSSIHHPDGFIYKECLPEKEVCEYWLNIQEKLTMVFHKDLVYADKGRLYLYNEHPSNYTTEVIWLFGPLCTFFKESIWLDSLTAFLKNNNIKAIVWYPMRAILGNARWTTGFFSE